MNSVLPVKELPGSQVRVPVLRHFSLNMGGTLLSIST